MRSIFAAPGRKIIAFVIFSNFSHIFNQKADNDYNIIIYQKHWQIHLLSRRKLKIVFYRIHLMLARLLPIWDRMVSGTIGDAERDCLIFVRENRLLFRPNS